LNDKSKDVVLGITGGIAAYKIPDLIRLLIQNGFRVIPAPTKNAYNFVTKTTLSTLTQIEPVDDDKFFESTHVPHLSVVTQPSILVIAPATANMIAKCANGIADDFLSTSFLSFNGMKLIVPAMHSSMYLNPITQENIKKLESNGVHFLGPATGALSSGDNGIGRMIDLELISLKIESMFLEGGSLKGKKIIITCGGTQEKIDNVRVVTNLSTGKLGIAMANLAAFRGAEVCLISTVEVMDNPHIKEVIHVKSVKEMAKVLEEKLVAYDYLYMAAAVSDYTFKKIEGKMRRGDAQSLKLESTEDILASLGAKKKNKIFIGFCLNDEDLLKEAREKMVKKNLDYIVANNTKNIGSDNREVFVLSAKTSDVKTIKASLVETANSLLDLVA
jgi:phosphopantothenoylcysteine decarboxylase / phosphopantothenate---cysteine ligase